MSKIELWPIELRAYASLGSVLDSCGKVGCSSIWAPFRRTEMHESFLKIRELLNIDLYLVTVSFPKGELDIVRGLLSVVLYI